MNLREVIKYIEANPIKVKSERDFTELIMAGNLVEAISLLEYGVKFDRIILSNNCFIGNFVCNDWFNSAIKQIVNSPDYKSVLKLLQYLTPDNIIGKCDECEEELKHDYSCYSAACIAGFNFNTAKAIELMFS